jgi:predicted pyridoxine 5'-phosphate oxidase superfamily flavin-nucleotide-binding protein
MVVRVAKTDPATAIKMIDPATSGAVKVGMELRFDWGVRRRARWVKRKNGPFQFSFNC